MNEIETAATRESSPQSLVPGQTWIRSVGSISSTTARARLRPWIVVGTPV